MQARVEAAPVFVVGAPRAGVQLVTWSLAQHPALEVVPHTGWIGRLSVDLADAYQAGSSTSSRLAVIGTSMEPFLACFGPAVERTLGFGGRILDPPRGTDEGGARKTPRRWVSGDPDHSLYIYGLSRVFPGSRFVHVARGVAPVVRSLVQAATPDGAYYTEASACDAWLRCVRACLQAEHALGPRRMLRIHHRELARDPERTLLRCLAFLEVPYEPACLRPLVGVEPDPAENGDEEARSTTEEGERADPRSWEEARALSRRLLAQSPATGSADRRALAELRRGFEARGTTPDRLADPASSVLRIRAFARSTTPEGSTVLVVSRGDPDLVQLRGRQGWHFPQTSDGVYAGHHPATGDEAVDHLDELRKRGAEYLLIPCTAFWWLEHYEELRAHLATHSRLVAYEQDTCLIFALRRSPERARVRLASTREEAG